MKKLKFNALGLVFALFFATFTVNAQSQDFEASAEATPNKEVLLSETPTPKAESEAIENQPISKNIIASPSPKSTTPQTAKQIRRAEKVEKILNSKVGQWVVKRALIKAEKKQLRQELKQHKGNKQAQQVLKEQSTNRIKALSNNLRMALIFGIVGLILFLIPGSIFAVLGTIAIIIALVFLLLEFV
ncbi:MAG: hypothetical protein MUE85_21245 [Microscillaceae bacterium]|jgi:hypothetical protein|nr:hypothetical protein [Microscillaceae bacterium]